MKLFCCSPVWLPSPEKPAAPRSSPLPPHYQKSMSALSGVSVKVSNLVCNVSRLLREITKLLLHFTWIGDFTSESCRNQLRIPPTYEKAVRLWGFFFVNVTLLQTSLRKCHLSTLFINSAARLSIIHNIPLQGSQAEGEAPPASRGWLRGRGRRLCMFCRYGLIFAQPPSPLIRDFSPFAENLQRENKRFNSRFF